MAGQAAGADLSIPPPFPPPAPAVWIPNYNWGGIYVGINGGFGLGRSDWKVPPANFDTGNFTVSGGLFGGMVGANVQYDVFVFGVEGEYDGSWIKGQTNNCLPIACETRNDWLATFRARAGYAADRVLFYGTVGAALGDVKVSGNALSQHENRAGWTAGGGIEAALADCWIARIEYLFVDLENATFSSPVTPATVRFDTNIVRAGLTYKFR